MTRAPLCFAAYNVLLALSGGLRCECRAGTWTFIVPPQEAGDPSVRDGTVVELIAARLARTLEVDGVRSLVLTEAAAPYLASVAARAAALYRSAHGHAAALFVDSGAAGEAERLTSPIDLSER
jgi:hypothetical protein